MGMLLFVARLLICEKIIYNFHANNVNRMKIILFGSTGMLGNYVDKYLSQYYSIIKINRDMFDIESCDWNKLA